MALVGPKAAACTYREAVKKVEPGTSQLCMVAEQEEVVRCPTG